MIARTSVGLLFTILGLALFAAMARRCRTSRRGSDRAIRAKGTNVKRFHLVIFVLLAACNRQETPAPAGDPAHGKKLIVRYGCSSCHIIPGIDGPRGEVGPSLDHVATRQLLAGKLPNSPQNMTQYLLNPQMVDPQNPMPNFRLKPEEARDIVAYLYTLR